MVQRGAECPAHLMESFASILGMHFPVSRRPGLEGLSP